MTSQLNSALEPLMRQLCATSGLTLPVSQVRLAIHGDGEQDVFATVRQEVLNWTKRRAGRSFPQAALDEHSFSTDEVGPRRIEAVAIEEPRRWSLLFVEPDREIAQRSWAIETSLTEAQERRLVYFGARLQCTAIGKSSPYERTVPRLVHSIIEKCDARLDGRQAKLTPEIVETANDVEDFVEFLKSKSRKSEIIVITLSPGSSDLSEAVVPVDKITYDLAGCAHVVVLIGQASFFFGDMVGRQFSVFNRAVRTYRPGFDPEVDDPYSHPIGIPNRIINSLGVDEYTRFITSETLKRTVEGSSGRDLVLTLTELKKRRAEIERKKAQEEGHSIEELLNRTDELNVIAEENYKKEIEDMTKLLDIAEKERDEAKLEIISLETKLYNIQQQMDKLRFQKRGQNLDNIPETLDCLAEWAEENLAGSVELHSRALRGAKQSQFEDIKLIYESLILLRDYYVPMRRGEGEDLKLAFEQRCRDLGLEEHKTLSDQNASQYGETYYIKKGNRKLFLYRHLKKGKRRDPKYILRIYFCWDEKDRQVVIGWLPSHLEISTS